MFSKPLAFVLLAVACVAAAGGGAYLATWQHERATAVAAAPSSDRASQDAAASPAAVAASPASPQAPATEVKSAEPARQVPEVKSTAPTEPAPGRQADGRRTTPLTKRAPERNVRQAVAAAKAAADVRSSAPPQPVAAPATTQPASPAVAPPAPVPPPQALATDAVAQGQRPWPGPPATQQPITLDASAAPPAGGQDVPLGQPEQQWQEVVVPTESVLGLQLETTVSSEFARVEDRVDARVTRDVRVGGVVAVPAGSKAVGSVIMVERGGHIKDRARIGIRFNTIILPDTTRLTIATEPIYREGPSPAHQSAAKIGGATIGGAILGAIFGGGRGAAIGSGLGAAGGTAAAMGGDRMPVVLPAGTTLSVRTESPINMTVAK